jgi:hypothetical protein
MSRSNQDHAKKTQRPLMDDNVIAQQLENLLTPAICSYDLILIPKRSLQRAECGI